MLSKSHPMLDPAIQETSDEVANDQDHQRATRITSKRREMSRPGPSVRRRTGMKSQVHYQEARISDHPTRRERQTRTRDRIKNAQTPITPNSTSFAGPHSIPSRLTGEPDRRNWDGAGRAPASPAARPRPRQRRPRGCATRRATGMPGSSSAAQQARPAQSPSDGRPTKHRSACTPTRPSTPGCWDPSRERRSWEWAPRRGESVPALGIRYLGYESVEPGGIPRKEAHRRPSPRGQPQEPGYPRRPALPPPNRPSCGPYPGGSRRQPGRRSRRACRRAGNQGSRRRRTRKC